MLANRISELFNVRSRFLRSAHLERDFDDPTALKGYVLTPSASEGFERVLGGLSAKSTQRAWRITGDYGTGKSSFALALAHLMRSDGTHLPTEVRSVVDFRRLGVSRPQLLPVLVTGSRSSLSDSLRAALAKSIGGLCTRGKPPKILDRLRAAEVKGKPRASMSGEYDIELLNEAAKYVRESGKADGILILLDELGKFLEFAALHPERQDIYFLQMLAETAARSAGTPIFVVGLLHQGFNAYAEQLSLPAQKEWEKIAGRYEEILFDQPLEQTTSLIAKALNVKKPQLPRGAVSRLEEEMARAVDIGWFGPDAVKSRLTAVAAELYPLHPSVIPVLVRLFSRFGQNERSLYSFLLSNEPYALQQFSAQRPKADSLYRIHNLYDFARNAFGHRLALQSFRSHWNQIDSVVESYPQRDGIDIKILKTVALMNLMDTPALLASEASIAISVQETGTGRNDVNRTLKELSHGKSVLYYRGTSGGYCLWPHTSVNLERAYQDASKAIPVPTRVAPHIQEQLETRPLVARKHYIETGNLRHFQVEFASPSELPVALDKVSSADGKVLVALCETAEERDQAIKFATSDAFRGRPDVLTAVPQPLIGLAKLVAEVQRWEWVEHNVPELNHDEYAREEVTRQLTSCRGVLSKRLQSFIGLRQFGETLDLHWFHHAKAVSLPSGRSLLEKLSAICDVVYPDAPQIQNELVNRHKLSSAAAAARLRLIERVLRYPNEPLLGMKTEGKPPEMSMYLSVLQAAKLHRLKKSQWTLIVPTEADDECKVRPVFNYIRERLELAQGARIKITDLLADLRRPPYGLRDGLTPLLLSVFTVIHEQDVAFYEKGGFVRQMSGQEFHRLIKAPEDFELQYCRISGVRTVVFDQLFKVLNLERKPEKRVDLLDVVRPLCVFAAQLPDFSKKSGSLSREAIAVREALLRAEEPATLIFRTLPEACGCERFESDDSPSPQRVKQFVERLRTAIDDLRAAYPELMRKMKAEFTTCFPGPGEFDEIRTAVAASAARVLLSVTEARLKAFCMRLADSSLEEQLWLESLGSYVCSKPPAKWLDVDLSQFQEELGRYARQFNRVESTVFAGGKKSDSSQGIRVSITQQDGSGIDQVLRLDTSELAVIASLEKKILRLLGDDHRLGLLAATRVICSQLGHSDQV